MLVMTNTLLRPAQWAESEFASAQLGDLRRTQRLVKIATNLVQQPSGTLPQAFPTWRELKAAYRFFNQPKVTFQQSQQPHWQSATRIQRTHILRNGHYPWPAHRAPAL
jgi:hypothetical protein